jgi:hypothetical protein
MSAWIQKLGGRTGIGVIFGVSFLFFLLVTFPYEILKESIANGLSRVTGLTITMDDFGAKFPVGFRASGLSVTGSGAKARALKLGEVSVRVNPLYLLAGKVGAKVYLENPDKSSMDVFVALPISALLGSGNFVPTRIKLESEKFRVDDVAGFALSAMAGGPGANPLLGPVLQGIGFAGKLDGVMDLSLSPSSPQDSSGVIKLKFLDSSLKLSDPALGLPDQKFSKAGIEGSLGGGILNIDKGSGFESEELTLTAGGSVAVKSPLPASQLQIELLVKLQKSLADKFGFLLDAFSGGMARGGELRLQVKGPVSQPTTQPI